MELPFRGWVERGSVRRHVDASQESTIYDYGHSKGYEEQLTHLSAMKQRTSTFRTRTEAVIGRNISFNFQRSATVLATDLKADKVEGSPKLNVDNGECRHIIIEGKLKAYKVGG
jgi:hypothetical protein